jgi:phosphoesterase RecJ-like protein
MNQAPKHIIWEDTAAIGKLLRDPGKQIAIITHVNPDGDALGSSLGLLRLLEKLGHSCSVLSPNDYPEFLKWMPGTDRVIILDESPAIAVETLRNADIIFALDFNDLKRVKKLNDIFTASDAYKCSLTITRTRYSADCILSDTSASSTAELVYRFAGESGMLSLMDKDIASCLFVGIRRIRVVSAITRREDELMKLSLSYLILALKKIACTT